MQLYDANAPSWPLDEHTGAAGESWVSGRPCEWLVRVTAPVEGGVAYALDVLPLAGCADDGFERPWRNDDAGAATPIGLGVHPARACAGDADWFAWTGGPAHIAVTGGAAVGRTADGRALPIDVDGPVVVGVTPVGEGGTTRCGSSR